MRITAIYNGVQYPSKSEAVSIKEAKEIADGLYETSGSMNKLQYATDDGFIILPENILKECILKVVLEPCDISHPDNT